MSDPEKRTDEAPEAAAETPEKGKTAKPTDPKKKPGSDYVFKIAPADPKNAFDFEDVADK